LFTDPINAAKTILLLYYSIVNRSKLINGDMLHNPNYQFDEDFILEFGFRL
jgi:hypothetical protein